jgi:phenylacetate-CoA ligase
MRLLRKALLAHARRLPLERMQARSRQAFFKAVQHAARHSAAYRVLLQESGLDPAAVGPATPLARLPVLTKDNTFGRFSLDVLARPLPPTALADVLTSSGRGGPGFGFRLATRREHANAWFDIDLGLQEVFGVDEKPTLLVNCLPMGVTLASRAVTVANVSVREDMACAILRDVGPRFAQTLLCTDPLFIRRLLVEGRRVGVDWERLQTSVILGEEMLVEAQREYIAARMGIDLDGGASRLIGSSFGVGELGLNLLFETRATIAMRRALRDPTLAGAWLGLPASDRAVPSVFCHNPLRCHIEVLRPDSQGYGELCFTMLDRQAVIPLPRFATGDLGRLLPPAAVQAICQATALTPPWLPVVLTRGRLKDRSQAAPSVEQVKEWLYKDHAEADLLSGAFKVCVGTCGVPEITVQLAGHAESLDTAAFEARLRACAADAGFDSLSVTYCTDRSSNWGTPLDHERKFLYTA